MRATVIRSRMTEEWSFLILRALAMIGGVIALFLVPHPPEHAAQLRALAWAFILYKAGLFAVIWGWPRGVRLTLLVSIGLDLVFVACFVWLSGGIQSHFYLLFYLLIALAAAHGGPGLGIMSAAGGGLLYVLASLSGMPEHAGQHALARIATFFLLGGSLGYLSRRERSARDEGERLNVELRENQERLEAAYQELQATQGRLLQAEQLATIGQMSTKISHEVRNPLSSISLNLELLEDELGALPDGRRSEVGHLVKSMRSQVDVLSAVTEGYLRFARLPKARLETGSLAPVIEVFADFVREELRARKVDLFVKVEEGLPLLRLDAGQIRQALLNLTRNAAESMPGGGAIRIEARLSAESRGAGEQRSRGEGGNAPRHPSSPIPLPHVEITVTDTGVGIPAGELEQVFEPFFTNKEGGTGLGLPISRQIILDHGGTLRCESVPGVGTTFRLTLPIPEEEHRR